MGELNSRGIATGYAGIALLYFLKCLVLTDVLLTESNGGELLVIL